MSTRLVPVLLFVACAVSAGEPDPAAVLALIDRAQTWLLAQQDTRGAFLAEGPFRLGITELAVAALASPPHALARDDARLARAIAVIRGYVRADGGIYEPADGFAVYGTALGLSALTAADALDERTRTAATAFLLNQQNRDQASVCFGGIGYGDEDGPGREDLHNTVSAIEGLRASGLPADDPGMRAALRFVEACQNRSRPGDGADRAWTDGDGGGVYCPHAMNHLWAPSAPNLPRKPFSYGSMTGALVESFILLDVPRDDPRVQTALAWLGSHCRFERNSGLPPGRDGDGLYYWYTVLAQACTLAGVDRLPTVTGDGIDWRSELFAALAARARETDLASDVRGVFWRSDIAQWGEDCPQLATVYALRALKRIVAFVP